VLVIGGGSAGFVAAFRASQLGSKVVLVEKERVGGICPNWGCIPMCYMNHCVEVLKSVKEAGKDGIDTGDISIDYSRMKSERDKVINGVVVGMEALLQATGVQVKVGSAKLVSPDEVEIEFDDGNKEMVHANNLIIANGSLSRRYDIPGAYGPGVLTTKELLALNVLPRSLAIIGRSVTALELATVWSSLGCAVSLIARKPRLLPGEDEELAAQVRQSIEGDGVKLYAGVDITRIDDSASGKSVTISADGETRKVEAQFVIFALGQQPRVEDIGLENAGVSVSGGGIRTNERMETDVKGIYAVGDVTGEAMLASVAMVQGRVAGENAAGHKATIDYRVIPRHIRTMPPIAAVGITEAEARNRGMDIKVSRFPFEQNPDALIMRESRGFVKIIADPASGELLGAHIIGPRADELIHELSAVMNVRGTYHDIATAIHVHPSLNETIQRAAENLFG